jgi:cell division septum initiation protein DivIVA
MKGRVKGLRSGTSPDNEPPEQIDVHAAPDAQRHALQVLTLAQRTAEEHIASAQRQGEKIQADARATAEQIVKDAKTRADAVRRDADKALSDARATAAQITRDAQVHADNARRNADKLVSDARARADEVAKEAQSHADGLKRQAEQRYQDDVGSLAAKREALQQQIEVLQQFDREYRARLTSYLQAQLRALWIEEPQVDGEPLDQPGPAEPAPPAAAQQPDAGATKGSQPAVSGAPGSRPS